MSAQQRGLFVSGLLIMANLVFAINQFNFASIYSLVAASFHQNISGLGTATSVYFLAIAAIEIPGGLFSVKLGLKKTVLLGTTLSFSANVLSAFLPQFNLIIAMRAIAGLGNGIAFPSLLVALARSFRRGSEGLSVGLVNGAFNLGGIIGLFGWAIIGTMTGWRISVLIGGILGLATVIPLFFILQDDVTRTDIGVRIEQLTHLIFTRELLVIVFSLFSIAAAASVSWGFLVFYLEKTLNVNVGLAGFVGSLSMLFSFFAAPIVGRGYDKFRNEKNWIFFAGTLTAIGIGLASFESVYFAVISSAIVGIGFGVGFTVGLSAARDLCSVNPEYESMAVGWVDGLSVFGGFFAPLLFAAIVVSSGYQNAWSLTALFAFLLTLPVLSMKKKV